MRILILIVCFCLGCVTLVAAQSPEEYLLWPDSMPKGNGIQSPETADSEGRVANVSVPRLYVYHPEKNKNTGMAVIICPGGGYSILAMKHEGEMFARWLAQRGITGVILKYRLPNFHPEIPSMDAGHAIRLVRSKAAEWGIEPDKIGIAGFSAGGHVASTAATHFDNGKAESGNNIDRMSSRPDFLILFYPVISMSHPGIVHGGSRNGLFGKQPSPELLDYYSGEKQVTAQTPPAFLVHCDDDKAVSPMNSVLFYSALKSNHVPAVLYILDKGGHGWGLRENFGYYGEWTSLLEKWLKGLSFPG